MEPKLNEKLSIGIYVKPFTITSTLQICLIISVLFFSNLVECNVVRRNSVDEILKSVKSLQDNCQQWTTRSMAEETFMESLASRLSLTEAKLENSISNIKYGETQRLMESKLSLIERLVENNFDRLAGKLEEMSETIRGLQTMVIINHNSTEEKIRKILNSVNGLLNDQTSNGRTSTLSSDSVSEIQGFLEQKLINTEKLVNRHVTLVKDEIKELLVDLKMKSWTNELTSGVDSVDNVDIVETVNQMRSDVSRKVDKIENQLKFAHQELNFKLDNQLGILKNISEIRSTRNTTDYLSCQTSSKESRSEESSTSSSASIELMTTTVEPFNNTISDSTQVHQILIDYSFKNRRCQIMPNKTSKANCDAIPFKTSWKTCADIYNDNITCDGIYLIMMEPRPSRVWCDMIDNGGGWMVILRRGNFDNKPTLISFNQNWFLYKYGFGDQKDEYWLGNEHIHRLTSLIPHQLQIDLESYDGQCISLDYGHFKIDSEDKAYRLIVADARGPHAVIGEQLLLYNNSAFNTRDRVNSRNSLRCGHFYGGWWFNGFACFEIFLTGELSGQDNHKGQLPGIHWYSWKPNKALKAVQMKIRPILK